MRALLSGHNGNLGQHIKKHASFEIVPLGRDDWERSEDWNNIDVFIHCAYDLKKKIEDSPDEILDSNLLSTMKALRLCKEHKIKKFIFMSSCSVYGHSSRTSEDTHCEPVTINGLTKYLNEKIILEFCEKNKIRPLILRAFNSYGGDDRFSVVSKMIDCAKNNKTFTIHNGGLAERDFTHVEDIAKVVCFYASNYSKHEIVNVGTGVTHRVIDLLHLLESHIGKIMVENKINKNEVEYSRADTLRLNSEYSKNFIQITNFLKTII